MKARSALAALALAALLTTAGCGGFASSDASQPTPPYFETENGNVTVHAAENQHVKGMTNQSSGENVTVRVRSSGDSPFLKTQTVDVGENGTFDAAFDFSDVAAGTRFEVTVHHNDTELATQSGVVTAA